MKVELWDIKLGLVDRLRQKKCVRRLLATDRMEWLCIGHCLNRWEWPPHFCDLVPKWWLHNKLPRKAYAFMHPLLDIIGQEFSDKEQLRYHNVHFGRMTNKEFEYWFDEVRNRTDINEYYDKVFFMEQYVEWWKNDIFQSIKTIVSVHED